MPRCFHISLPIYHLVSLSSKKISFTESKHCLWSSECLQSDDSNADLWALFLFAKGCIFLTFLYHLNDEKISRKYLGNLWALLGISRNFFQFVFFIFWKFLGILFNIYSFEVFHFFFLMDFKLEKLKIKQNKNKREKCKYLFIRRLRKLLWVKKRVVITISLIIQNIYLI